MKNIPIINSNKNIIIDDEDFELVSRHKWYLHPYGYAYNPRMIDKKQQLLHRLIMNPSDNIDIDHKNHDPLDNRRENLRFATTSQNIANRKKTCNKTTSKLKGVCWHRKGKKWESYVTVNQKRIHLGLFKSEEEAAIAYDLAALKHFREFSKLNFPERITIE